MSKAVQKGLDWETLFTEFVTQEETSSARAFLAVQKKWPPNKIDQGNTDVHIRGWSERRAQERRSLLDARKNAAITGFQELLPKIYEAKRSIIEYYIDILLNGNPRKERISRIVKVRQRNGKTYDRVVRELKEWREPLNLRDRSHILTKLKTELGEPALITKQQNEFEGTDQDPAAALLIAMGIFVNGSSQTDGTGARKSVESTAQNADAQTPSAVS